MYDTHVFKVSQQSRDYAECSAFVIQKIEAIITAAMDSGQNKILIDTNLKFGLPMENINKIAGPYIHYITLTPRTTWELCQLLDKKCIDSKKGYDELLRYAKQHQWIKDD